MPVLIDHIYPLIAPQSYYSAEVWDLPHHDLTATQFILTWVSFQGDEAMTYLTRAEYKYLNETQSHWQRRSFENLRRLTKEDEYLCTHFQQSELSKNLSFIIFMHQDGIGSSRILLSKELEKLFPEGYFVAIPDRSCGVAISKDATPLELSEMKLLLKNMYTEATTPMSSELFDSNDFELINNWALPLDIDYFNEIINEVKSLYV
ncbi:hypothetical protein QF042_004945 [Pedobacter sp. W3I1]|uniref:hypothetical protein n=1 Tax=Pedobacter sp. W3I1 TaxID=3042291 RepID=UPI002782B573|nr:hypothetical protein [Pedobacter sp. W3I1]MDQ0641380.1 hypothetical protein [Pedobacter sp. W3I1]